MRQLRRWVLNSRPEQYWLSENDWPNRLLIGGRGAGKTRAGAEWVRAAVEGRLPGSLKYRRIALVGETLGDVREVMIEGVSGILAVCADEPPLFEPARRRIVWRNGAVAQMFSSEDPESLRGPQFDAAWGDEVGKWKNAGACYDMLQFGVRLGKDPRQMFTTTPRATPLMKRLLADPRMHVERTRTADNAANLAPGFLGAMDQLYGTSKLARQELGGEMIEDRDDALWKRERIEACQVKERGDLRRIVVAVDPPASSHRQSDACGIVAAGIRADGSVLVLADATLKAAQPTRWAGAAVALFRSLEADCIVAEVNQGGDMVTAVIRNVDATVPVRAVRANRGKWVRAEPVSALYDQDRVFHAGRFPELEDEMCDFGPDGLSGGRSPDRVDALVWAVTELTKGTNGSPRVRAL